MRFSLGGIVLACFTQCGSGSAQQIPQTPVPHAHSCGQLSSPDKFAVPKGTMSYYQFVSAFDFGSYTRLEYKPDTKLRVGYDPKTNEYFPTPIVAFVMMGGEHASRRFPVRLDDCVNVVIEEKGRTVVIRRVMASLHFPGVHTIQDGGPAVMSAMPYDLLKAILKPNKVLIIGRWSQTSAFINGENVQHVKFEFDLMDYHVLD